MPKVVFIDPNGVERNVEAPLGKSLMDVAIDNNIDMEAACEGALACSTCHVIVDQGWFGKLEAPDEDEEDMLDLTSNLAPTSRLACQITMTDALDGLVVRLPSRVANLLRV